MIPLVYLFRTIFRFTKTQWAKLVPVAVLASGYRQIVRQLDFEVGLNLRHYLKQRLPGAWNQFWPRWSASLESEIEVPAARLKSEPNFSARSNQ